MIVPVEKHMKLRHLGVAALLLVLPRVAEPCTIERPVSPEDMVRDAEAIVRVLALEYARPPGHPTVRTAGTPDAEIRFRVLEVVKGRDVPPVVVLSGYLVDRDDFNDLPVPYRFVRPGGRDGNCFATSYKQGAEFLLMLKKRDGAYTANWYGLGPVNEQLRSADDPWLRWVREQVAKSILGAQFL